jgi:hypothetical protein
MSWRALLLIALAASGRLAAAEPSDAPTPAAPAAVARPAPAGPLYGVNLKENGMGGTYWAAGPWWGNYPLSVEPRNGQDRPQMAVLLKFAAPAAGGR